MPQFISPNSLPIIQNPGTPIQATVPSSSFALTPAQAAAATTAGMTAAAASIQAAGVSVGLDADAISTSSLQAAGSVQALIGTLITSTNAAIANLYTTDPSIPALQDVLAKLQGLQSQLDPIQADIVAQENVFRAATPTTAPATLSAALSALNTDRVNLGSSSSPSLGSVQQVIATAQQRYAAAAATATGTTQTAYAAGASGMTAIAAQLNSIANDLATQQTKITAGITALQNAQVAAGLQAASTLPGFQPAPGGATATNVPPPATTTAQPLSTGTKVAIGVGVAAVVLGGLYAVYAMQGGKAAGAALSNPLRGGFRAYFNAVVDRLEKRSGDRSLASRMAHRDRTYIEYRYQQKFTASSTALGVEQGARQYEARRAAWGGGWGALENGAREFPSSGQITWGPGHVEAKRT